MKVYLNKEYKCVKVEDNTFVANDSSNYIRYYFVTNANGDVIDKMDDTSVIYRNTEPSYVTVAFRRADGNVIQHLMASPKTDVTGNSFFEYEITDTDGVLYKKGALEISAQFIEATLSETGGVQKVISKKVKAIAINTAHVLDNIGEEAEEYYSQYEQANNDAHAVLQTQITTNFNNIGTLQELTTDAKDDLVQAINEVDAHADANKSEIGDLSTLTTDEKTTIVGAINEVDAHADTAQQTADNATELANTGISKAEQAQATANNAVATANEAKTTAQTAENNANSAVDKADSAIDRANKAYEKAANNVYAVGFMTLQEAITAVNGYDNTVLKTNDNIIVVAQGSPDLYVTSVEATSVPYNFTTVDKFNDDLVKNTVLQIGYYKVAFYETDGQPVTVAYQNVVVKSTDWVASTEFADFPYEAKITLSNFVDYKTVPQVVFDIADTMSGNYAPICKSGDKCVYIYGKVQNEITLKTVITFAPNVNGASVTGGGYNNRGKWVASTTYAIDDLVYTDNGQYVCIEGITSTTSPEQDTTHWQATFVATGKTKNGLKFSGQDNGTKVQKTFDGSQAVEIAFDENTMTAKEVNGVLEIGAKGTIPEALPQEASAVKSGNLPTSGWSTVKIVSTFLSDYIYSISDTSITANSDILMELTDDGGVKSYSMEAGKITVIRDTVPTQPIQYTYKVKQTNASGQFTLVNHYVPNIPVTSVNGQTGAVTITVPTKTSQLTNDSGFITSSDIPTIPTKTSELENDSGFVKTSEANTFTAEQTFSNANGIKANKVRNLNGNEWYNFDGTNDKFGNTTTPTIIRTSEARPKAQVPSGETTVTKEIALLEDIPSAGEWVTETGTRATLTEAGTYQVIASVNDMQSIVYWDGTTAAYGTKSTAPSVSTSGGTAYLFINCAYPLIDASGTLSVHLLTAGNSSGTWTETDTVQSGFKYRKIN